MHAETTSTMSNKNDWRRQAACATSKLDFFATRSADKYAARALCRSACPVRLQCLDFALNNRTIYGIFGGVDEYEIRRALSVDGNGVPYYRARKPRCPFCSRGGLVTVEKKRARVLVQCSRCSLSWWIRKPQRETVDGIKNPENGIELLTESGQSDDATTD